MVFIIFFSIVLISLLINFLFLQLDVGFCVVRVFFQWSCTGFCCLIIDLWLSVAIRIWLFSRLVLILLILCPVLNLLLFILEFNSGIYFLLVCQKDASATYECVFFATAQHAAITSLLMDSPCVPYENWKEDCQNGAVEHQDAHASVLAEATQGSQRCEWPKVEGKHIRKWCYGNGRTWMHHSLDDPLVCWLREGYLVKRVRYNEHIIDSNTDQQEWHQIVHSSYLLS